MSIYQDFYDKSQKTFSIKRPDYSRDSAKYLKYCTKCNKVWEKASRTDTDNKNTIYYKDFPTIGKKRKNCERCK
jgi:hypothetical protein